MRHLYAKFVCKISPEWNNLRKKDVFAKGNFFMEFTFSIFFPRTTPGRPFSWYDVK